MYGVGMIFSEGYDPTSNDPPDLLGEEDGGVVHLSVTVRSNVPIRN